MDREAHATRPTTGALFALLYRPGPRWVRGEPLDRQPLAAHRAYLEGLARAGRVAIAGPFLDAAAGLAVLRVADAEAAAAVLADDPAVRDGVLAGEVRRWLPLIGDMAPGQRAAANVEAVRRVFAAVEARGDGGAGWDARWAVYRDAYAPEAAIHEAPSLPYGGDYEGPDAIERHARGYNAAWDGLQDVAERALEPECLAGGDRVAVLWRQRARPCHRRTLRHAGGERLRATRRPGRGRPHVPLRRRRRGRLPPPRQGGGRAVSGPEDAASPDRGAGQAEEDWGAKLSRARAVLAAQPFSAILGAQLAVLSADGVELRLPVSAALAQQHGSVHGGVVAYLADNALAFAGGLRLPGRVVTAEMKINYVRPATGEALVARGHALSAGRAQAVARCEVFAVAGGVERLCAAAQGTIAAAAAPPDPSGSD